MAVKEPGGFQQYQVATEDSHCWDRGWISDVKSSPEAIGFWPTHNAILATEDWRSWVLRRLFGSESGSLTAPESC